LNSCLFRNIEQIIHHRLQQRNPFLASDRFRFSFGIARNKRAVGAGCRLGFSEDLNPFVDLFFKFVFVDEAVDFYGAEEG
jgi:hypothetical protein